MIDRFSCKETEKIWNQVYSKKFPSDIQAIALRKLIMINRATDLNDLKVPPGNRLEKLRGNRESYYSIRVNNQWRICFKWVNDKANDVHLIDYH
ncbi:MAG: type II toxin-antitoxin system RelE/ParE family toxin [Leptospirales bacterium]